MKKLLPWILLLLAGAYVVSGFRPAARQNGFALSAFGRTPALLNGRVQPLDSVGRNALLQIRARQSVPVEGRPAMQPTEWLLEVLTQPAQAESRKIFRIDNGEVISLLKLPAEDKYFSFKQLDEQVAEIEKQAEQIDKIENAQRTPFQRALMRLYGNVNLYQRLRLSLMPPETTNYVAELTGFEKAIPAGVAALEASQANQPFDRDVLNAFVQKARGYERLAHAAYPLLLPPLDAAKSREDWANVGASLMQSLRSAKIHPALFAYAKMADAWRAGKADDFNQAVTAYHLWLQQNQLTPELGKGRREFIYQQFQGFYHALVIYVLAFVIGIIGLLVLVALPEWSEALRRSAFALICLAASVHTLCLLYRMILEGRPPVTNLYSSAIFIGWAAVLLGLGLERVFRVGIGNTVASLVGFATLVIAHNLSLGGDTMEMMRAVLDDNFWLAIHVVTVTLGYSAMFVAGLIASAYVILALINGRTPILERGVGQYSLGRVLSLMVYAIIAFATVFSFVGTVTGGIWADQSWGRFWGWDPKENGALLIVLWCAIYLHARWGKLFQEAGLMNLAIFGNVVTAWSWFGVNMLGVGLHSYGFMDAASKALLAYAVFNALLMILGAIAPRLAKKTAASPPSLPAQSAEKSRV
jgi:ABC-type transport system involved in cytochrome c biogenesis permease subunit